MAVESSTPSINDLIEKEGVKNIEQPCLEKDLVHLAEYCDPWELVGRHLGLKQHHLNDIRDDHKNAELRRLGVLQKWKQMLSFKATYRVLVLALISCKKVDQALSVCQFLAQLERQGRGTNAQATHITTSITTTGDNRVDAVGRSKSEPAERVSPPARKIPWWCCMLLPVVSVSVIVAMVAPPRWTSDIGCHKINVDDRQELTEIIRSHGSVEQWCLYLRISDATCNQLNYSTKNVNDKVLDVAKSYLNEVLEPCWEDIVRILCKHLKNNRAALKLSEKHSVDFSSQCKYK